MWNSKYQSPDMRSGHGASGDPTGGRADRVFPLIGRSESDLNQTELVE